MTTKRMLTGDRPTGKLHLGHYVGSLANRVQLHREYESFFIIADLHMLTTRSSREAIEQIGENAREAVLDMLSVGIDPEHATFYLQSALPGIHELYTLFQSLITVPMLERLPSLKDMARASGKSEMPFALLGYPILQAADILCVRSQIVPVGKDNLAHVEITREIARRFNSMYGEGVLPVPEPLVGEVPTLVGTDGDAKMSKSLNNAIYLSDDSATVHRKVRSMFTDPNRITADVPGETVKNPVFAYHRAFNDRPEEVAEFTARYEAGAVGDVEVKDALYEALERFLAPIRERRAEFEAEPGYIEQLIVEGTQRTGEEVLLTLREVKKAMGLAGTWNRMRRKVEQREKRLASEQSR
jgi:tryptophanyl-tRNA synthetase